MIGIKQTNEIMKSANVPIFKTIPDVGHLVYIFVPIAGILNRTCSTFAIENAFANANYIAEFLEEKTAALNPNNPHRIQGCKWLAFRVNAKESA